MLLSRILSPNRVLVPFEAQNRWSAIQEMSSHLTHLGLMTPLETRSIVTSVTAREEAFPTGMEHGVALPHAAVSRIEEIQAVLAISPAGVDFGAIDGRPSNIILLLAFPRNLFQRRVRTLAGIARLLNDCHMRNRLLTATTGQEVWGLLQATEEEALRACP